MSLAPSPGNGFGDADWANLRNYFAKKYEITAVQMIRDAVLGTYSSERAYHPIRDYLESLSWDGTARIDSLLENYLGAENSEYTQQTIAITLIAAVAQARISLSNGPRFVRTTRHR